MNDHHSTLTESNLGKSVLDGVVTSIAFVFIATNKSTMSIFFDGCRSSRVEAIEEKTFRREKEAEEISLSSTRRLILLIYIFRIRDCS